MPQVAPGELQGGPGRNPCRDPPGCPGSSRKSSRESSRRHEFRRLFGTPFGDLFGDPFWTFLGAFWDSFGLDLGPFREPFSRSDFEPKVPPVLDGSNNLDLFGHLERGPFWCPVFGTFSGTSSGPFGDPLGPNPSFRRNRRNHSKRNVSGTSASFWAPFRELFGACLESPRNHPKHSIRKVWGTFGQPFGDLFRGHFGADFATLRAPFWLPFGALSEAP